MKLPVIYANIPIAEVIFAFVWKLGKMKYY